MIQVVETPTQTLSSNSDHIGIRHTSEPSFYVRDVPVYGDVILSPMAGFSDEPFRLICREYGSAMSYTEFVADEAIIARTDHAARRLAFDASERPMVHQFFGCDEDKLEHAAHLLEELQPDIIDLNMGCSTRQVSGRGAGAGLLPHPKRFSRIIQRLTHAVSVPITAKIRLGWDDDQRNYLDVARRLEDSGVSLIAVHGRTKAQAYKGSADWDAIAEIKQVLSIPLIGNGDVRSPADIERIKQHTGCDGVMIGRAAIGNPWIFQRQSRREVDFADQVAMVRQHLELMIDFYGPQHGLIRFRKHVVKYVKGLVANDLYQQMVTCPDVQQFRDLIAQWEASGGRRGYALDDSEEIEDAECAAVIA